MKSTKIINDPTFFSKVFKVIKNPFFIIVFILLIVIIILFLTNKNKSYPSTDCSDTQKLCDSKCIDKKNKCNTTYTPTYTPDGPVAKDFDNPIDCSNNNELCILTGCPGSSKQYLYILFTSGFNFDNNFNDYTDVIYGVWMDRCSNVANDFISNIWRKTASIPDTQPAGFLYGTDFTETQISVNYKVETANKKVTRYINIQYDKSNTTLTVKVIPSLDYKDDLTNLKEYSNYKICNNDGVNPAVIIIGPP